MTELGCYVANNQVEKCDTAHPLRYLLHALNQPLTALQCSLELSVARPNHSDRDLRTLNEALDLTSRMRMLVEALHEVANTPDSATRHVVEAFSLGSLLRELITELLPVAENKRIRIHLLGELASSMRADRIVVAAALFRFLEAVLGIIDERGDLKVLVVPDSSFLCMVVSWKAAKQAANAITRQELALLVSQYGLKVICASCDETLSGGTRTCTLRLPVDDALKSRRTGASI